MSVELMLRHGESYTGEILDKEISITTELGDEKYKTRKIAHIHFRNPPEFQQDEIALVTTDEIRGTVTTDPITFKIEASGQVMKIQKGRINTIVFLDNF